MAGKSWKTQLSHSSNKRESKAKAGTSRRAMSGRRAGETEGRGKDKGARQARSLPQLTLDKVLDPEKSFRFVPRDNTGICCVGFL